jgi:hypothetical protein
VRLCRTKARDTPNADGIGTGALSSTLQISAKLPREQE